MDHNNGVGARSNIGYFSSEAQSELRISLQLWVRRAEVTQAAPMKFAAFSKVNDSQYHLRVYGCSLFLRQYTGFSHILHTFFSKKQLLETGVHIISKKYGKSSLCFLLDKNKSKVCTQSTGSRIMSRFIFLYFAFQKQGVSLILGHALHKKIQY